MPLKNIFLKILYNSSNKRMGEYDE